MLPIESGPLRPPLAAKPPAPKAISPGRRITPSVGRPVESASPSLLHCSNGPKRPRKARRRDSAKTNASNAAISEVLQRATEVAAKCASAIREEFGQSLTREDCSRLARAFQVAVIPKRKPGRRPKPQVTAAYDDWKAGIRGAELYAKHIPSWTTHNRYRKIVEQKTLIDAIRARLRRNKLRLCLE